MIEGSIVALITPFKDNLQIDFNKLGELIEFHYENKTDALLLLGTTSESPTLTELEKDQLVEYAINKNAKRMKIVVGVCENCTKSAIKKAKKYEELGADCLLVISPFYNKSNDSGLILHFTTIADAVNIPIILYNIPGRTGINIDAKIMSVLKEHPRIIGVKEANRDLNHIMSVRRVCDEGFGLFCGNDDLIYLFLSLGAKGIFTVYGNLDPLLISSVVSNQDDKEFLNDFFNQYFYLLQAIFIETNPIPIKELMNYCNWEVGLYRLPLAKMDANNKRVLINEYERAKKNLQTNGD